ncbi:MAG: AsmA-like C-terminal region-containing protein [bacterium]
MKKVFIALAVVVALLLLAAILVPLLFKDKIVGLVKSEANKQLNATLEFADIRLSLFSDFPNFNLSLDRLALINQAPFAGDTLISLKRFQTSLDIFSLFGGPIKIRSIALDEPRVRLIALEDGSVNWNITKETAPSKPEEEAKTGVNLALQEYAISDGKLVYYDQASGMSAFLEGLNHSGSGDFSQDRFSLRTLTDIASLTFASGEVKYLNKVHTTLKADVDIDNAASRYTLLDNELRLNDLALRFGGAIAKAGENMELEVKFEAPQNDFKSIISLIPAIYAKDFKALKSSGLFALQGQCKGTYSENHYPAFNVQLQVNNGMFQYPQLPAAVKNVNLNLSVNNPGGELDDTVIDLTQFHVEMGRDPFDASLQVKTPVSDPELNANIRGRINLGEVKNLFPLEAGTELGGLIDASLSLAGRMSSAEQGRYEQFHAAGSLSFRNLLFHTKDLPEKIAIAQAQLNFNPANVKLSDLNMKLGNSDLEASGTLDNLLAYVMKDQTLKGSLSLQSRYFDLDPWMAGESAGLSAVALPDKIDFSLNSAFQEVKYDKLRLHNVRGTMLLKDRTLHLQNVSMNLLNGAMVMNGRYSTPPDKPVNLFFDLKVNDLSIGQTFQSFVTVQKFAPIAQSLQGNFSSNFQIATDVDSSLMPIFNSLNSQGALRIASATLANFTPLTKLADVLKMEKYKTLSLADLHPSFHIRDGRFFLEPVSFKVANTEFVVSGSNGIDQSLDYALKLRVPAKELNQQANAFVNDLLKQNVDPLQNEYVDLVGAMKGSITAPQVQFSGGDLIKGVAAQATNLLQQEMDKQKKAAADSANALLAKQKEQAEKLRRAAVDSAKSETEKLKAEAKKKLKDLFKP